MTGMHSGSKLADFEAEHKSGAMWFASLFAAFFRRFLRKRRRTHWAQEPLVEDGEIRHVDAGLPAAQARKQRDHQHLEKVAARRVAGPGILDPL